MGNHNASSLGSSSNLYNEQIEAEQTATLKKSIQTAQITREEITTMLDMLSSTTPSLLTDPALLHTSVIPQATNKDNNPAPPASEPQTSYNPITLSLTTIHTVTRPLAIRGLSELKAPDAEDYGVNYDHVKTPIIEFTNTLCGDDNAAAKAQPYQYTGARLLLIFDTMNVTSEDCSLWQTNFNSARNHLKRVLDYAEGVSGSYSKPSEFASLKLRVIIQIIAESSEPEAYKHICLLLASHGHVCNVMKEVAINNAYGMMTNNLEEYVQSRSLEQQVLKALRDLRVLLIETMFHEFGFGNNTHVIAGFHNTMAEGVGVDKYTDPDISYPSTSKRKNWKVNLDARFLAEVYTKQKIVDCVYKQMDEKKIGYQKMVLWLEEKCPQGVEKTKWLENVIDVDTGKVHEGWMCWMLAEMGVLVEKDHYWKPMEVTWTD